MNRLRRLVSARTIRAASIASFALALAACGDLGFEAEITDREPFDPPATYGAWWEATKACSGTSGRLERIAWYRASSITVDGALAFGAWTPPHEIVILDTYELDEPIVRHEMLHDLLGGDARHQSPAWATCDLILG